MRTRRWVPVASACSALASRTVRGRMSDGGISGGGGLRECWRRCIRDGFWRSWTISMTRYRVLCHRALVLGDPVHVKLVRIRARGRLTTSARRATATNLHRSSILHLHRLLQRIVLRLQHTSLLHLSVVLLLNHTRLRARHRANEHRLLLYVLSPSTSICTSNELSSMQSRRFGAKQQHFLSGGSRMGFREIACSYRTF